jgi:cytochrome c oxidase assembly protein subunit 15
MHRGWASPWSASPHAELAMITTGLVLALLLLTRVQVCAPGLRRRVIGLTVVIIGQSALGFVQYLADLPAVLILLHVAGATALWGISLGVLQAAAPSPSRPVATRANLEAQISGLTAAARKTTVR